MKKIISYGEMLEYLKEDKIIYEQASNDENLISFWNKLEYEIIIDKLKEFYKNKGFIQFDDDFLNNYNLSEEDLKKKIML